MRGFPLQEQEAAEAARDALEQPFSHAEFMARTVRRINKHDPRNVTVTAEHYLWLAKQARDAHSRPIREETKP